MTLGELIRVYRSEHNMNMQEFANHCGLSKAYISILERNINPSTGKPPIPSLETIRSIAKTLHMDFNDVIAALDGDQVVLLETSSPRRPAGSARGGSVPRLGDRETWREGGCDRRRGV